MEGPTAKDALDQLLSETPDEAAGRVTARVSSIDTSALLLYGAGTLGRAMLERLRRAGVEPVGFADDTPAKHGQVLEGLRVRAPREAAAEAGARACFVVTILNPLLRFRDARRRLTGLTELPVLSFIDLAWKYPESCLPWYSFERPETLLARAPAIRRAFGLWADEESRRQFVAHLRFRLHLDHDALPESSGEGYFPSDTPLHLPDDTVFVDCGAYDGDTVRHFLEHQRGRFGLIHAFEPDAGNMRKLRAYVASLDDELSGRIRVYEAGVGDRHSTARFNATGDMSAARATSGTAQIEIVRLEDTVTAERSTVYVKLDVEGAEREALEGAATLLTRARPALALSVYHRPDDLWELPLYLDARALGYRFFLRTCGEDGMDVVCYAIPPRGGDE